MWNKIKPFLWPVLGTQAVGALAFLLIRQQEPLYEALIKPSFAPPGSVFPVVWTLLYLLMGIGLALVQKKGSPNLKNVQTLYWVQLAVNFCWPLLFFRLQAFFFSFLWLLLQEVLILCLIGQFYRHSKPAALLQLPYLLWVAYAGVLNFLIFRLNG